MLTVACVNVGDYLGRGSQYVEKMRSMVSRHLSLPHRFECITESDKSGWWAKTDLFAPGRFDGRVLYLDLDSVIVGSLDALAQSPGIIDLRDWGWKTATYCSAVMVWDAGEHEEIYRGFSDAVPEVFRGDQDWITHLGGWDALPAGIVTSYRYAARSAPPTGASVIQFHGRPKPHEIAEGWVPGAWR